jgi:hypothetical protein
MPFEFSGLLVPFNLHHLLVYGPDAQALGEPRLGPPVYVRPGYRFVTHNAYLLPTETIDDIGQHLLAPECYTWIENQGDAFPRADVIGVLPTGEKESVFMKELDLAEMAAFASAGPASGPAIRVDLAIEALASPDTPDSALTPVSLPAHLQVLSRALPCYRLAPGVFGAVGAALLNQLLATRRRDWRLTFDDLDDILPAD